MWRLTEDGARFNFSAALRKDCSRAASAKILKGSKFNVAVLSSFVLPNLQCGLSRLSLYPASSARIGAAQTG